MADYDLKYTGAQIDGLLDAANELKTNGFIYKGVATPSTNPGTPTERVAYLASEPGTYTNFGGIVIASGLYSLTYASGTWTGTQMSAGSDIQVVQTTGQSTSDVMSQKAVTDEIMTSPQSWDLSYGGDFTWELGTIHDDGKAYHSSSYYHLYIPVSDIKGWKVYLKAKSTIGTYYTLLKNIGFAYPVQPLDISSYYCEGYSTKVAIIAGEAAEITIPDDCNYIYIECGQISGQSYPPESGSYYTHKWSDVVQTTGQSTTAVMSQKAVTEEVQTLSLLNLTNYKTYVPDNSGKWNMQKGNHHYQVPIEPNTTIKLSATNSLYTRVWFCTAMSTPARNQYVPFCNGESAAHVVSAGQTEILTTPSDCKYIYVDGISAIAPLGIWVVGKIKNEENIILSDEIVIPYQSSQAVNATTGQLVTLSGYGHSDYYATCGARQIYVYVPNLADGTYGVAFFPVQAMSKFISGVSFGYGGGGSQWMLLDIPENANFLRMTLPADTDGKYRLVFSAEHTMEINKRENILGTQIFRMAKTISPKEYIYAFGISQQIIIGNKSYVHYAGNTTQLNGDTINNTNVGLVSVVDLFDMSSETHEMIGGTYHYANGNVANPVAVAYVARCGTPDNKIATFGVMRFNDKNPWYCFAVRDVDSYTNNYTTCLLSYDVNGVTQVVDFTLNNYRQMLVNMGYISTYIASTVDAVDNINLHYNYEEGIYYAVLCGSQSSSQNLPLVLMQSTDLSTWTPRTSLGVVTDGNEIEAIYKDGIVYVAYRTHSHGMNYCVYDLNNSTIISSGLFNLAGNLLLVKPDVFTFENDVYMAVNIVPYKVPYYSNFSDIARSEIAIYKIVNGVPKLLMKACNPTGINYFSFMETPLVYADDAKTQPIAAQGAIYIAFSEDRRHLYRRQFAQVSFADVTALFADFGRIG